MLLFPRRYLGRCYQGYAICRSLGQGRYGNCFAAQAPDGSQVVLKRFHNRMKKKNTGRNHFEPVILSMLKHPSIPDLLGVINEGKDYFFVLEYMPGVTIEQLLFREHHRFTPEETSNIGFQLIDLIAYLHQNGIVHRDIRISNVLYHQGKISLVDFGLARFADQDRYRLDSDFSYLGDFLLYLLYSNSPTNKFRRHRPWYDELPLSDGQMEFLKRLLGLETPYATIEQVREHFFVFMC
ncbi:protein kinase [Anaerovorax odorimutans]|uniref:Protein kinase n=1 Tax=Anaerovorax odorimutans TaxID=109327 RepID=A0ABT1RR02_9FIRM|nr:protein kinase [Anaerovorax odorimutans]MCQ4637626.1 protein kinase [Anaerovorax odorimutans]